MCAIHFDLLLWTLNEIYCVRVVYGCWSCAIISSHLSNRFFVCFHCVFHRLAIPSVHCGDAFIPVYTVNSDVFTVASREKCCLYVFSVLPNLSISIQSFQISVNGKTKANRPKKRTTKHFFIVIILNVLRLAVFDKWS